MSLPSEPRAFSYDTTFPTVQYQPPVCGNAATAPPTAFDALQTYRAEARRNKSVARINEKAERLSDW